MTKQTYKSLLEELQNENMELKRQIRELKKQLEMQVFDERPLEEIITGYREEKKELSIPTMTVSSSLLKAPSDFMSQYRKYRELVREDVKQEEIKIDVPTINNLKSRLNQKPA